MERNPLKPANHRDFLLKPANHRGFPLKPVNHREFRRRAGNGAAAEIETNHENSDQTGITIHEPPHKMQSLAKNISALQTAAEAARRSLFFIFVLCACQEALFESVSLKAPEGDSFLSKEFCSPERMDYFRLRSIYGDQAVYLLSRSNKSRDPRFIETHNQKARAVNRLLNSGADPKQLNKPLRDLVRFMEGAKSAGPQAEGPNPIQNWILDQIGGGYKHFSFSADICFYLHQGFEFSGKGKEMILQHTRWIEERDRLLKSKRSGISAWEETSGLLSRIEPAKERLSVIVEDLIQLREGFERDPASWFQPGRGQKAAAALKGLDGSHHDENFYCVKGCLYKKPPSGSTP